MALVAPSAPVHLASRSRAILIAARLLVAALQDFWVDLYHTSRQTRLRWALGAILSTWATAKGLRAYIYRRWTKDQSFAMVELTRSRNLSSVSLVSKHGSLDEDSDLESTHTDDRLLDDFSMSTTRFGLGPDDHRLTLVHCAALEGLAEEALQFLLDHAVVRSYGARESIFEQGDQCTSFVIVHSGEVHLSGISVEADVPSCNDLFRHIVTPGKTVEGLLFVFASIAVGGAGSPIGGRNRSCTARAGEAGAEVIALPTSALDEAFTLFPAAMKSLAQLLCTRFSFVVLATLAKYFGLQSELIVSPKEFQTDKISPSLLEASPAEIFGQVLSCSAGASDAVAQKLSTACFLERDAGEYTTPPHQVASHLMVLLDGELHLQFEPCISRVDPGRCQSFSGQRDGMPLPIGCIIGELSILVARALPLNYRCRTRCRFAALPREAVQHLLELCPRDCCLRILQITACKTPMWLHRVDACLDWVHVKGGHTLFRQGDPSRGFFVVLSGRLVRLEERKCAARIKEPGPARGSTCPEWHIVESLERGRLCGELDCLDANAVHSDTVRASRDTEVCEISFNLLELLTVKFPKAVLHFSASIARKGKADRMEDGGVRSLATIAVVPSDASVRIHEACIELTSALKRLGKAIHVSPDSDLTAPASGKTNFARSLDAPWLARVLAEKEERCRWLVYEAEPAVTPWTRCCVRNADLILVVVRFDGSRSGEAPPSAVERYVEEAARNGLNVSRHLLMLHDPFTVDVTQAGLRSAPISAGLLHRTTSIQGVGSPMNRRKTPFEVADTLQPGLRGFVAHHLGTSLFGAGSGQLRFTRHYLAQRPWMRRWHHIRIGERGDWDRCARLIVGQGIGLCLGGGGARGNLHFGVIRAMEELGVPIDAVSGCSFGALAGGIYCMTAAQPGSMMQVVEQVMGKTFSIRGMLMDFNFPRTAAFTGKFLNIVLQRTFARRRCEDMLVPFLCTTTDIVNFEGKTHMEGPIWRVVRASMSLVGFVPPLPHQEPEGGTALLVDGGYTNQYPTEELRELGVGTVISVKACPDYTAMSTDYGDSVRGGTIALLRRLGIKWRWYKGPDPPSQAEIQERLKFLPDELRGKSKDFVGWDLSIEPPIDDYGLLEFHRYRELELTGYNAAHRALTPWIAEKTKEEGHIMNVLLSNAAAEGAETQPPTLTQAEYLHAAFPKVMSEPEVLKAMARKVSILGN